MKKFFTVLIMAFVVNLFGQQTVLFHENFDLPSGADSVSTGSLSGTNPPLWSTTTTLATSPTQSYKVTGSMISKVYFETQSFSTAGVNAVYLSFNHIAKVNLLNGCKIYVSTNNGSTWTKLTGVHYFGSSPNFSFMTQFNETSYFANNSDPWGFQATGSAAIPQASWWITEDFDISSLAIPSSGPGYTQVKLRFEADFAFNMSPGFAAGWFVDDVKVIGAPCELRKPQVSFYSSTFNCQDSLLTGDYNFSPTFIRTLRFNVTDNAILDSVRAVEIINGGSPKYSQGLPSPGTSLKYHNFMGYNPRDTVQWAIEAYDMCGNLGRFPDTGYYMFYFADLPQKCLGGECDAVHQMIDTFPWKEDFEGPGWAAGNGLGGSTGRGSMPSNKFYEVHPRIIHAFGWSVLSGASTSIATGTNGDHTTGAGNYFYTDFTGQSGISSTTFSLPCIDLRDSISRMLTFYYHMYGSDIERLKVDIDTTPGAIEDWKPVLKLIGEQHTSNSDPWKKATISLEPFRGKIVKLRFYGQTLAGNSSLADIAIDDIEIKAAIQNDLVLNSILSPNAEPCTPSSAVPVAINIINNGLNAPSQIPVAYQLDNFPIVYDTINNLTLPFGDTVNFTFVQSINYSPAISHSLKVWVALSGDSDVSSDTLIVIIPAKSIGNISTFPYFQNFEAATTSLTTNGNINSSSWTLNTTTNGTNSRWMVREGLQNDSYSDLTRGLGVNGTHVTFKRDALNSSDFARMESKCIDLNGLTNPVLQFHYHVMTNAMLYVDIREPGMPWTTLATINGVTSTIKGPMPGSLIDLFTYAGKTVQIAFRGKNNGSSITQIASIDNVTIQQQQSRDLALIEVGLKGISAATISIPTINCEYTDFGTYTSQSFYTRLKVELIDACNPSANVITGMSDSLLRFNFSSNRNLSVNYTNISLSQPLPVGTYTAKYWIETSADQFAANDTFYSSLSAVGTVLLPYFDDFEGCNTDVYANGNNNQWEITTPNKPQFTQAKNGLQCAITNADSVVNQINQDLEILRMPDFEGLDTLYGVELRFWQKFEFGPNSGRFGSVQINDNGLWKPLVNQNLNDSNWSNLMQTVSVGTFQRGFTGSSSGWAYSIYPLLEYKTAGRKAIRFVCYNATDFPGWAIDDFEIYVPSQNSGSPEFMSFVGNTPLDGPNTLQLTIRNTAAAPLNKVKVIIESNGAILYQETIIFSKPIQSGQTQNYTLSQPVILNPAIQELIIRTTLPNNRLDVIPMDDTLRVPVRLLPQVTALPECFGFESNPTFLDFDTKTSSLDTLWEYGSPGKVQLNAAHTGTKAWFTKGSLYQTALDQHLYTPVYPINQDSCYRLSFWQNFDTEKDFDGGNIEFTLDSGLTWQTLGRYWSTDSLWYNSQFVQSLDLIKPGFSGNSGGWILAQNDFKVFANAGIQFRFRFASNADISGEGWAIDDVCLEAIGSNCKTIGLEPEDMVTTNAYLYPVPTSSKLYLRADLNGPHQLIMYDQRGALIRKWSAELDPAVATSINIEKLAAGVYWLQVENANEPIILKFIKD